MCSAASSDSEALGSVEDLHAGSSPHEREHAAARIGADEVAVADRVGGAVEAGRLAVPDAEHAVVARARQRRRPAGCPTTAVAPSSSLTRRPWGTFGLGGERARSARAPGRDRRSGEPW